VGDERPSPSSEERETSASKQQDDGDDACDYEEQHVEMTEMQEQFHICR